jgi:hypothetical protein
MMAFMMLFFEKKDCFDLKMFAPCSFFSEFQKKIETYSWDTLVEKKECCQQFLLLLVTTKTICNNV